METQGSYRCTSSCTIWHVSTVLTHVQQVTNGCSCPWTPRESQCDLNPRKDRASSPVKLPRAAPINTDVHPVSFHASYFDSSRIAKGSGRRKLRASGLDAEPEGGEGADPPTRATPRGFSAEPREAQQWGGAHLQALRPPREAPRWRVRRFRRERVWTGDEN